MPPRATQTYITAVKKQNKTNMKPLAFLLHFFSKTQQTAQDAVFQSLIYCPFLMSPAGRGEEMKRLLSCRIWWPMDMYMGTE